MVGRVVVRQEVMGRVVVGRAVAEMGGGLNGGEEVLKRGMVER